MPKVLPTPPAPQHPERRTKFFKENAYLYPIEKVAYELQRCFVAKRFKKIKLPSVSFSDKDPEKPATSISSKFLNGLKNIGKKFRIENRKLGARGA